VSEPGGASAHPLREPPEAGALGEDGGLDVVDTRIAVQRYWCVECETTCTVLPAEVRAHAEILRTTVSLALAAWVLHPDDPSAEKLCDWMFPNRRCVVGEWAQLREWASGNVEVLGPDEVLEANETLQKACVLEEKFRRYCEGPSKWESKS